MPSPSNSFYDQPVYGACILQIELWCIIEGSWWEFISTHLFSQLSGLFYFVLMTNGEELTCFVEDRVSDCLWQTYLLLSMVLSQMAIVFIIAQIRSFLIRSWGDKKWVWSFVERLLSEDPVSRREAMNVCAPEYAKAICPPSPSWHPGLESF